MSPVLIRAVAFLPLGDVTVLIDGGRARCRRGRVRPGLLSAISECAGELGIGNACIHIAKSASRPRLTFWGVPREHHQRLRNLWLAEYR